jgi:hypothetical protein
MATSRGDCPALSGRASRQHEGRFAAPGVRHAAAKPIKNGDNSRNNTKIDA